MGWLDRMFNVATSKLMGKTETPPSNITIVENASVDPVPSDNTIAPERLGLNGEYDQSGLAKRVALAFDEDPALDDEERLWVAQTGGMVVLKGTVASQAILDKMVSVASKIKGATSVNTEQVTIS